MEASNPKNAVKKIFIDERYPWDGMSFISRVLLILICSGAILLPTHHWAYKLSVLICMGYWALVFYKHIIKKP